eukprot:6181609-Pleurochrysis_carterae.AAC.1
MAPHTTAMAVLKPINSPRSELCKLSSWSRPPIKLRCLLPSSSVSRLSSSSAAREVLLSPSIESCAFPNDSLCVACSVVSCIDASVSRRSCSAAAAAAACCPASSCRAACTCSFVCWPSSPSLSSAV